MPDSPVTYTVDEARGLVETTIREGFTYPDIVATFVALRTDPRIRPEFDRLAVYEATHVPLTTAEVRTMVEAAARVPHSTGTRVAVVVRCDVMYGMMRMYELYGDSVGIQVRVFRDRIDADRWLNRRPA